MHGESYSRIKFKFAIILLFLYFVDGSWKEKIKESFLLHHNFHQQSWVADFKTFCRKNFIFKSTSQIQFDCPQEYCVYVEKMQIHIFYILSSSAYIWTGLTRHFLKCGVSLCWPDFNPKNARWQIHGVH